VSASHSGSCSFSPGSATSVTSWRPLSSHSFTSPSKLPVAIRLPSGLTATAYTTEPTASVVVAGPIVPFHTLTVLSAAAETSTLPSLLNASSCTATPWPASDLTFSHVLSNCPSGTLQTRTVLSKLAEARRFSLG